MPQQSNAGCLGGWLANILGDQQKGSAKDELPPILLSKKFITEAETNFYRVLRQVVGNHGIILMQVALNQLLYLPNRKGDNSLRATWRNRIAQKSLDFLILDPKTMQPLVAIELDDASHARPSRQTRDDHVETVLNAVGLPLLRCLPSRTYNTEELRHALTPHLRIADPVSSGQMPGGRL